MKKKLSLVVLVMSITVAIKAQVNSDSTKLLSIGETRVIHSAILKEKRTLNIYLPHGYDKGKAYPVIYLLDGSIDEDFLHIVGLVQFFHMMFRMPDFIVVGIANVDRKRDFTFHTDLPDLKKDFPTTGRSENFINFIENELQPYIQSTYKTTETRYIIGQSLGGLVAVEILLRKPALFTHYLLVSPSLWWDNESLLKNAAGLIKKNTATNRYIYVAVGADEEKIMQEDAKEIVDVLKQATIPGWKVDFLTLKNENHATILHQSINEVFKLLFPFKD